MKKSKSKVVSSKSCGGKMKPRFRNGGEVGGIGGGSGVDGSGNRGNGGFGGGRSGQQGGGGLGGGGKGGVGGTGSSTGVRTGTTANNRPKASMPGVGKPRPIGAPPPKVSMPKPAPKPGFTLPPKKNPSVNVVGGNGVFGIKGGPADKPVNRQDYKNNVVGGSGVPGYGGSNYGRGSMKGNGK